MILSRDDVKKFHKFTNDNFRLGISWKTRKIKYLFKIEDKNMYPACKIYYRVCKQCGDNYICETVQNIATCLLEQK